MSLPESPYFVNPSDLIASSESIKSDLMVNSEETTTKIRQYLELKSKQLRLDLEAAGLFKGKTETGTVAEDAIRRFLRSSLPPRYSVSIGEVISPRGKVIKQTETKDVIIYDATSSPIFNWGEIGFHLFPIESVYAIIEVKKTISSTREFLRGIKQAIETKRLEDKRPANLFTALIVFDSRVKTETLAKKISDFPLNERVDFILILNPKLNRQEQESREPINQSDYIAHWRYYKSDSDNEARPIEFVTAQIAYEIMVQDQTYNPIWYSGPSKNASPPQDYPQIHLTWGRSEHALMWFYLFLTTSISKMETRKPNLWKYTQAKDTDLGYREDSSCW